MIIVIVLAGRKYLSSRFWLINILNDFWGFFYQFRFLIEEMVRNEWKKVQLNECDNG